MREQTRRAFVVVSERNEDGLDLTGFVAGYEDEKQAKADANERTERARKEGWDYTYRAIPNPTVQSSGYPPSHC